MSTSAPAGIELITMEEWRSDVHKECYLTGKLLLRWFHENTRELYISDSAETSRNEIFPSPEVWHSESEPGFGSSMWTANIRYPSFWVPTSFIFS